MCEKSQIIMPKNEINVVDLNRKLFQLNTSSFNIIIEISRKEKNIII